MNNVTSKSKCLDTISASSSLSHEKAILTNDSVSKEDYETLNRVIMQMKIRK